MNIEKRTLKIYPKQLSRRWRAFKDEQSESRRRGRCLQT